MGPQFEAKDEATLHHYCELWEEKRGVKASIATISRPIHQSLGCTSKKAQGVSNVQAIARDTQYWGCTLAHLDANMGSET